MRFEFPAFSFKKFRQRIFLYFSWKRSEFNPNSWLYSWYWSMVFLKLDSYILLVSGIVWFWRNYVRIIRLTVGNCWLLNSKFFMEFHCDGQRECLLPSIRNLPILCAVILLQYLTLYPPFVLLTILLYHGYHFGCGCSDKSAFVKYPRGVHCTHKSGYNTPLRKNMLDFLYFWISFNAFAANDTLFDDEMWYRQVFSPLFFIFFQL